MVLTLSEAMTRLTLDQFSAAIVQLLMYRTILLVADCHYKLMSYASIISSRYTLA